MRPINIVEQFGMTNYFFLFWILFPCIFLFDCSHSEVYFYSPSPRPKMQGPKVPKQKYHAVFICYVFLTNCKIVYNL